MNVGKKYLHLLVRKRCGEDLKWRESTAQT